MSGKKKTNDGSITIVFQNLTMKVEPVMVRGNSADVVINKAFYYVQPVQTCKFKCVTHGKKQSNITMFR